MCINPGRCFIYSDMLRHFGRPFRVAAMKKILVVFGTRPEVIKLAPVISALRDAITRVPRDSVRYRTAPRNARRCAGGLRSPAPTTTLDLMKSGQHPGELVGRLMLKLTPLINELEPDLVVVQGDTSTVMCGALAGFMCRAQVAHVEAGLANGRQARAVSRGDQSPRCRSCRGLPLCTYQKRSRSPAERGDYRRDSLPDRQYRGRRSVCDARQGLLNGHCRNSYRLAMDA